MPRVSHHSRRRLVERDEAINTREEAKRVAKIAWRSGKTIGSYNKDSEIAEYLRNLKKRSRTCAIRIYNNQIFIWRGSKQNKCLVTAYNIPQRYLKQ